MLLTHMSVTGSVADCEKKAPTRPKKALSEQKEAHINATYSQNVKENTYYLSHFTCSLLSLNTISSISFLPFLLTILQVLFISLVLIQISLFYVQWNYTAQSHNIYYYRTSSPSLLIKWSVSVKRKF